MADKKRTMVNFIVDVLKIAKNPLTYKEIWDFGKENNIELPKSDNPNQLQYLSSVLTGWYKALDDNNGYTIKGEIKIQYLPASSPHRWYLADKFNDEFINKYQTELDEVEIKAAAEDEENEKSGKNRQIELMLYPFLTRYMMEANKVHIIAINDKNAKKSKRGLKKWQHPDLVGFSIRYDETICNLQAALGAYPADIYSFEMKREIKTDNYCEYYYQALSNSSWANYGYLVTDTLDETDTNLMDQLRLLNERFGIGILKLNTAKPKGDESFDILKSKVLFEATYNPEINWDIVSNYKHDNPAFKTFCQNVIDSIDDHKKLETLDGFEKPWTDGGKVALDNLEKEKGKVIDKSKNNKK